MNELSENGAQHYAFSDNSEKKRTAGAQHIRKPSDSIQTVFPAFVGVDFNRLIQ